MFSCIKFEAVSVLLVSVSSFVVCQIYDTFGENGVCNTDANFKCQTISNCPSALEDIENGGRPNICSFEGNELIVCCDLRRTTLLQQDNVDVITVVSHPSENTFGRTPNNGHLQSPFGRTPNNGHLQSPFGRTPNNGHLQRPFGRTPNNGHLQSPFGRTPNNGHLQSPFGRTPNNGHLQRPFGWQNPTDDSFGRLENNRPTTDEGSSGERNKQSSDPISTTTRPSRLLYTPPPIPGIKNTKSVQKCQEYGTLNCGGASAFAAGAEPALLKQFPHMALIGFGPENDKFWHCGGSVISKRYILSAAHCTFPGDNTAKWVRLGDLDHSTTRDNSKHEDYTIIERIDHPRYNPPLSYNDIALYKVDRHIDFNDYIRPICLHTTFDIFERQGRIAGWGRIEFVGPTSNHLLHANISFVNPEKCKANLQNKLSRSQFPDGVTDSIVCAGEADGSKDTCQGDSGGPLFISQGYPWPTCLYRQVGVTSTGRPCTLEDSPGIYTRVSSYIPWIESIVWANDP